MKITSAIVALTFVSLTNLNASPKHFDSKDTRPNAQNLAKEFEKDPTLFDFEKMKQAMVSHEANPNKNKEDMATLFSMVQSLQDQLKKLQPVIQTKENQQEKELELLRAENQKLAQSLKDERSQHAETQKLVDELIPLGMRDPIYRKAYTYLEYCVDKIKRERKEREDKGKNLFDPPIIGDGVLPYELTWAAEFDGKEVVIVEPFEDEDKKVKSSHPLKVLQTSIYREIEEFSPHHFINGDSFFNFMHSFFTVFKDYDLKKLADRLNQGPNLFDVAVMGEAVKKVTNAFPTYVNGKRNVFISSPRMYGPYAASIQNEQYYHTVVSEMEKAFYTRLLSCVLQDLYKVSRHKIPQ